MSRPRVSVFGLGPGDGDDLTLGTINSLKSLKASGTPLFLRTRRHPAVISLAELGLDFDGAFDEVYEKADSFDSVYSEIVSQLIKSANDHGAVGYAVPGHPLFGEQTVRLLLARQDEIDVVIKSCTSFVDACLTAARQESVGLVVLDGLSLPDPTDNFRSLPSPFNPSLPNLIYQVYDSTIASRVKLALLDRYGPEVEVLIIRGAGLLDGQNVTKTELHLLDRSPNLFDHLTSVLVPPLDSLASPCEFSTLRDIMAQLRHPTKGCPWDREQTPETLKRYAIEEVYEVIDAIDEGDVEHYVEELGDLILQVVFHAQLAREAGEFTIDDVISSISEKLIRRHPHVFGELSLPDTTAVLANWEIIKKSEKGNTHRSSRLDGVPNHLPALLLAQEVSKRAAKAGFEWDSIGAVFEKVEEEIVELKEALHCSDQKHIASELGDLLFTVVNLGRFAKVDSEDALRQMVRRFTARFKSMERAATQPLEELAQSDLESLWQAAKREQLESG